MQNQGAHAVVLGASISGLVAARVLSDFYRQVTVVERDRLPEIAQTRKGVAHDQQIHALLPSGAMVLEELFPGLFKTFEDDGVPAARDRCEVYQSTGGHVRCRTPHPIAAPFYQPSRPYLEHKIRERMRDIATVAIIEQCEVVGLLEQADQVIGARIVHDGLPEETIEADLVVDTTGRAGRAAVWLQEMGYRPPAEDKLVVQLKYVSQRLRISPRTVGLEKMVLIGAVPGRLSGMALFAQEDDQWILSVSGYDGHHPPTDRAAMLEFIRPIAPAHVYTAIRDAEPLSGISSFRLPANLRRRYERLERFPHGLLVLGDALCCFNPLYGQGMTVAAMQASALRDTLAQGDRDLARRFFRSAAATVNPAWNMAIGGDLALLKVKGARSLRMRAFDTYMRCAQTAAEHDPIMVEKLARVSALVDPPTALLTPAVIWRVVTGNIHRPRSSRTHQLPQADGIAPHENVTADQSTT